MRIEATAGEIRRLLQLTELDSQVHQLPPDAYRTRREAIGKRVARALLDRYQTLLQVGRSPAVVPMERDTCAGCHVRLPTMIAYQIRRSPAVHVCPHCRRMLYAPELLAEEGPRTAPAEKTAVPQRAEPAARAQR